MTAANFETLKTLWTDESTVDGSYDTGSGTIDDNQGLVYYTELVTDAAVGTEETGDDRTDPARSLDYFTRFICGATSTDPDDADNELQECYKYQLADDETLWSDGYPRFEKTMRVQTYLISSIGIKEEYALCQGEIVLTGASMLALGTAIAATVVSLF